MLVALRGEGHRGRVATLAVLLLLPLAAFDKVNRAGVIGNTTNELYAAWNASGSLGSATAAAPPLSAGWRVDEFFVSGILTQNFNYDASNFNSIDMAVTGNGLGDPPDLLDINWFMLKVTQ